MEINRIGTTGRWSDAVIHNHTLYLVEVPSDLSLDITGQTKQLLAIIEENLIHYGSSKAQLLMVNIYLKDITTIDEFNQIWDSWLPKATAPVRACIEAKLANDDYLVEIQVIAAISDGHNSVGVKFLT